MKKITGVYVNADEHSATTREIEASLDSYYRLLDVDCIDIVTRQIGGKYFDIICDDEALLKADPEPTMIDGSCNVLLCGNLFICSHKGAELASITKADVKRILGSIRAVLTRNGVKEFVVGDY